EKESSSMLLDLSELNGSDSCSILSQFENELQNHGFDSNYLEEHLLFLCSDGASVMRGGTNGVITKLGQKYNYIIWHCTNHRFEIAIGKFFKLFEIFKILINVLDHLYVIFKFPKARRELAKIAKIKINQFTRAS